MIKIIKVKSATEFFRYALMIDSEIITNNDSRIHAYRNNESKKHGLAIYDNELSRKVLSYQFSKLSKTIEMLGTGFNYSILQDAAIITEISVARNYLGQLVLSWDCYFIDGQWKHLWSPIEYVQEILQITKDTPSIQAKYINPGAPEDGFRVQFPVEDVEETIEAEAFKHVKNVRELHELAEKSLMSKLQQESVVLHFDFPEEVKVPCEQYLLYFAQFLKDLGVDANTALTHEAGQVLFTVTPDDKQQALDKIRAALEVYLHLPSSPVSDTQQGEIAILRLNSELQNFQSKLSLARAEIQMKEAAIQLHKVTIAQLTGEVVIESLKDVTPKPKDKDKEELLGDIVSLVPLKGKGFEVNLPELFRKLKQMFKDKE